MLLFLDSIKRLTACRSAVSAVTLRLGSKTSICSNRVMKQGDVLGKTVGNGLGTKFGKNIFLKSGSDDASGQFSAVTLPTTRSTRAIWVVSGEYYPIYI